MLLKKKKAVQSVKSAPKTLTSFRPMVLTRHPSHRPLRLKLPLLPFRSIVRLGSTTVPADGKLRVEINSPQVAVISGNKLRMKQAFTRAKIKCADWWVINAGHAFVSGDRNSGPKPLSTLPFPLISKSLHGSKGKGNSLLKNEQELKAFIAKKDLTNYIFEKYYTYSKEYRIHVTKNGYFYACRKMLKNGTPEEKKFQRHDDNCVWILETNNDFDKPINWNTIVGDCVSALKEIGADILAFDVKTQSSKDSSGVARRNPEYIIIESNSAPSFGEMTTQKYLEIIPQLLKEKYNNKK